MMEERIYKYKLDFYYKSLIIYLITLLGYIIIKGNFTHATYELVIKDPIIYIIILFIVFFLIILLANTIRAREIIFRERMIIFRNRFEKGSRNEILNVRLRKKEFQRKSSQNRS
jgi:hypothetical protein